MKINLKKILEKVKTGFSGFRGLRPWRWNWKSIPFLWIIFSIILFIAIIFVRFPFDKIAGKLLMESFAKTEYKLSYENITYSFPLQFSIKSLNLKSKKGVEFGFYDVELLLNPFIFLKKDIDAKFISNGARFKSGKIFFRSNLNLKINIQGAQQPLSKIKGSISLDLKKADFSDLRAILKSSPKTALILDMLGEKIPKKLIFSQINLLASLANKIIRIEKCEIKGKEIIAAIKGRVILREDSFYNSQLKLELIISHKSPIWKKFQTEKELLKNLNLFNSKGDIKIPISGSIESPRIDLKIKTSSLFNRASNPNP